MKILRKSTENEMILNFLKGELTSYRFSEKLLKVLKKLNLTKDIIINADLNNFIENKLRKTILEEFRGYNKNEVLFENFPKIKEYLLCEFSSNDLKNIFYINYSYWNELSNKSSSPLIAAKNIKSNKIIYNVSNQQYLDCLNQIKKGKTFTPLIFLTYDKLKFIVLEGHLRITAYALQPELFKDIKCIVLECSKEDLEKWNSEI